MVNESAIIEVNQNQLRERYGYTGKAYMIADVEKLG
jgi:hypothetical protein